MLHKAFREWQHPSALDQWIAHLWANSLETVSFTLTHYLVHLFPMHHGLRSIPLCIHHHIQLTSLSFHVKRPSHSLDMTFSKFDLKIPRPRSWVRWTLRVTTWVQYSIDSHPFRSMSIGHLIPEIWLFQNMTMKSMVKVMGEVKVESHKVGVTSYRLTSLSFHVNQPLHSWETKSSKFDLENPRWKWNGNDVAQLQV